MVLLVSYNHAQCEKKVTRKTSLASNSLLIFELSFTNRPVVVKSCSRSLESELHVTSFDCMT